MAEKDIRQATIDDVARLAGVPSVTVVRVFNREPNVPPEIRRRIEEIAAREGYPLEPARRRDERPGMVALLDNNPVADYVLEIQHGALAMCRHMGCHLLLHPCNLPARELLESVHELLRDDVVDGFLVTPPVSENSRLMNALEDARIPFVRISQRPGLADAPCVSVNDEEAAREVTEYLISLGHERIAFIQGDPSHGASHDRLAGFKAALEAHGLALDASLVRQGYFNYSSGQTCGVELLNLSKRPTAIFAANDDMALGALEAAHERGLHVPQELSLVGFDDTVASRFVWPPLTTVRQPIREAATRATELLIKTLRGEEIAEPCQRLRSEIVLRCSTSPPARA